MPAPRLKTAPDVSSNAARRAMMRRTLSGPGCQGCHRPPDLTAETGIKRRHVILLLVFVDHEHVDQTTRNADHLRVQRPALRESFHLANDRATGIVDRLRDG